MVHVATPICMYSGQINDKEVEFANAVGGGKAQMLGPSLKELISSHPLQMAAKVAKFNVPFLDIKYKCGQYCTIIVLAHAKNRTAQKVKLPVINHEHDERTGHTFPFPIAMVTRKLTDAELNEPYMGQRLRDVSSRVILIGADANTKLTLAMEHFIKAYRTNGLSAATASYREFLWWHSPWDVLASATYGSSNHSSPVFKIVHRSLAMLMSEETPPNDPYDDSWAFAPAQGLRAVVGHPLKATLEMDNLHRLHEIASEFLDGVRSGAKDHVRKMSKQVVAEWNSMRQSILTHAPKRSVCMLDYLSDDELMLVVSHLRKYAGLSPTKPFALGELDTWIAFESTRVAPPRTPSHAAKGLYVSDSDKTYNHLMVSMPAQYLPFEDEHDDEFREEMRQYVSGPPENRFYSRASGQVPPTPWKRARIDVQAFESLKALKSVCQRLRQLPLCVDLHPHIRLFTPLYEITPIDPAKLTDGAANAMKAACYNHARMVERETERRSKFRNLVARDTDTGPKNAVGKMYMVTKNEGHSVPLTVRGGVINRLNQYPAWCQILDREIAYLVPQLEMEMFNPAHTPLESPFFYKTPQIDFLVRVNQQLSTMAHAPVSAIMGPECKKKHAAFFKKVYKTCKAEFHTCMPGSTGSCLTFDLRLGFTSSDITTPRIEFPIRKDGSSSHKNKKPSATGRFRYVVRLMFLEDNGEFVPLSEGSIFQGDVESEVEMSSMEQLQAKCQVLNMENWTAFKTEGSPFEIVSKGKFHRMKKPIPDTNEWKDNSHLVQHRSYLEYV